ncbi:hypothetical protein FRX31_010815 [Thalictrum thalictroides]|uniref:Uncharacterized protein n=1 Tax=Thalictrum thalictroides TaxID=46969 RepID=A0A7J6WSM1_THATH|nr:hypothetical protein FRX31_010815 [Thalictrum thalictroides]
MPIIEVQFLPQGISDHTPILLSWITTDDTKPGPFLFFNHWVSHPDFMEIVERGVEGKSCRKSYDSDPNKTQTSKGRLEGME